MAGGGWVGGFFEKGPALSPLLGGQQRGDAGPVPWGRLAWRAPAPPPRRTGSLIKKAARAARHSWCLLPAPRAERRPRLTSPISGKAKPPPPGGFPSPRVPPGATAQGCCSQAGPWPAATQGCSSPCPHVPTPRRWPCQRSRAPPPSWGGAPLNFGDIPLPGIVPTATPVPSCCAHVLPSLREGGMGRVTPPSPLHPSTPGTAGTGHSSAPGGSGDRAWHRTPTWGIALPAATGAAEPRRGGGGVCRGRACACTLSPAI